jgi:putative transposase
VNPPNCTSRSFVNFLISTYQACSCTEASRCLPDEPESKAHDSVKRSLERQPHDTEALYDEVKRLIRADEDLLVIDDSTLDKPYSHHIEQVTRHWSGKHHRVVQGINLISTIWTDGSAIVPVDFRIYCPDKDGKNKNDHFRDMLRAADEQKFQPGCIIFDSWYSSIDNLKLIRTLKWHWCTRLKFNRLVDPDHTYNRSVSDIDIPPEGRIVHLRQYGFIKVFRIVHSTKYQNTGLSIFWKRRNRTEKRSRILVGISKRITGELSSVVGSRNAWVAKRLYNEDTFCSRCSLFFASNLIV